MGTQVGVIMGPYPSAKAWANCRSMIVMRKRYHGQVDNALDKPLVWPDYSGSTMPASLPCGPSAGNPGPSTSRINFKPTRSRLP